MHADGGNLWLQVGPTGSRSWIFRYALDGKARAMGLGPVHSVPLAQARQKAAAARALLAQRVDPMDARANQRPSHALVTFKDVALDYVAAHASGWHNAKHRHQWTTTLSEYVFPIIGALPVAGVDVDAVLRVLRPIWNTKTVTAIRVRGRIESVLGAAIARGIRTGPNPAVWRGTLSHLLPPKTRLRRVQHHAAMPYADVPAIMAALRSRSGNPARALELLVLTAARSGEVLGARWSEIDLAAKVWTIPGERMKAGLPHRVPLAAPALAILAALPRDGDYVFPGLKRGKPISKMAMARLILSHDVTVHGFRSTFRDWAAEATAYQNHVVEMALAHSVGNAVEAAYRRGDLFDKRRDLMTAWGAYCGGSV
jgi:integrase